MKASYNAEHTLSAEFAVPSPSLPHHGLDTSEVIIPGYNQASAELHDTKLSDEKYALYFHGVEDLSDRPEAQKFVDAFEVKDSYGLIYYAVENLIDFNHKTDTAFGSLTDQETPQGNSLHQAASIAKENALSGTVKTVSTQMALNSTLSYELDDKILHQEAYIAVLQMQAVVEEDRALRARVETQSHINVVTEEALTPSEKQTSHLFGTIISRMFGYKHLHLTDFLPRSSEIPVTAARTLPTQAIKSTGITRPR